MLLLSRPSLRCGRSEGGRYSSRYWCAAGCVHRCKFVSPARVALPLTNSIFPGSPSKSLAWATTLHHAPRSLTNMCGVDTWLVRENVVHGAERTRAEQGTPWADGARHPVATKVSLDYGYPVQSSQIELISGYFCSLRDALEKPCPWGCERDVDLHVLATFQMWYSLFCAVLWALPTAEPLAAIVRCGYAIYHG